MSSFFGIFSSIIMRAKSLFSSSSSSSSSSSVNQFNDFISFLDEKITEINTLSDKTITEEEYNNLMQSLNQTIMEFSNQVTRNIIELSDEQRFTLLQKLNTILDFLKNKGTSSGVTPDLLKENLDNFLTPNSTPQSSQEYGGSKRKSNRKSRKSNRKSRKSNKKSRKSNRKSKKSNRKSKK